MVDIRNVRLALAVSSIVALSVITVYAFRAPGAKKALAPQPAWVQQPGAELTFLEVASPDHAKADELYKTLRDEGFDVIERRAARRPAGPSDQLVVQVPEGRRGRLKEIAAARANATPRPLGLGRGIGFAPKGALGRNETLLVPAGNATAFVEAATAANLTAWAAGGSFVPVVVQGRGPDGGRQVMELAQRFGALPHGPCPGMMFPGPPGQHMRPPGGCAMGMPCGGPMGRPGPGPARPGAGPAGAPAAGAPAPPSTVQ